MIRKVTGVNNVAVIVDELKPKELEALQLVRKHEGEMNNDYKFDNHQAEIRELKTHQYVNEYMLRYYLTELAKQFFINN